MFTDKVFYFFFWYGQTKKIPNNDAPASLFQVRFVEAKLSRRYKQTVAVTAVLMYS